MQLADLSIIPFDLARYSHELNKWVDEVKNRTQNKTSIQTKSIQTKHNKQINPNHNKITIVTKLHNWKSKFHLSQKGSPQIQCFLL